MIFIMRFAAVSSARTAQTTGNEKPTGITATTAARLLSATATNGRIEAMTLKEKVDIAIERLRMFEPPDEPYYLCYSGGKDSDAIRILAELAGVRHEIHHNLTTVDAPETIQYIKSIPNVIIDKAHYTDRRDSKGNLLHKTMWNLIPLKGMPPTRLLRYCCAELKEVGGKGKLKITGVRWEESTNRQKNSDFIAFLPCIGQPIQPILPLPH
jgi:3'-phosphoadenosine 5'-phosphosulfate sulfotransferase (PAPS reductase)/FAD synthetase